MARGSFWRMHDADDGQEHRHESRQHHKVHHEVALQRDQPEQRAARHALQAVLATRERRLQPDEVDHLRHGQRDHGEIDALAADGDEADQRPQHRARQRPGQDAELRRKPRRAHQPAGDVGRRAEVGGVAEAQQARVAQQQVEGAGEDGKTQRLDHEDRIDADEGRGHQQHQTHAPGDLAPAPDLVVGQGSAHLTSPFRTGPRAGSSRRWP